MARLPRPIPRDQEAELSLTEEGKVELARLKSERTAVLDDKWPKPDLGDILTLKERLQSESAPWLEEVERARRNRYNQDDTPAKWKEQLSLPDDRRFHTNLSGNEIERVVALLGRNPPKVTIQQVGSSGDATTRAEKQSRWSQELLSQLERDAPLPLWQRGDDAAAETGVGGYEWYMTDRWERVDGLIAKRTGEGDDDPDLDKLIEAELQSAGLPFAVRMLEPTTFWVLVDEDGISEALIVERKNYRQVYRSLREKLSAEAFQETQLPRIGDQAWSAEQFLIRYQTMGQTVAYNGAPDTHGDVEVIRYYDRRWIFEAVAGRETRLEEHGLPGVPVFPQLGKVTSSADARFQRHGVTWGMLAQELALNDLFTLWLDNMYSYGRPFPVVATSEQGAPLLDKDGQPQVVNLSDPRTPPQLGPGQTIVDAFGSFRGHIEPAILGAINSYWQMSGLNPILQGEAPGADNSGFSLNIMHAGGQALYESMLQNKQRTLGGIVDFSRIAIRDTIAERCYLSVPAAGGGVEFLDLGPEDIDEVPSRVEIDPISDAQRLAEAQRLEAGNAGGYVARRTVQKYGYGDVIENPDDEDKQIVRERARDRLLPVIVESVVMQVQADAFPETVPPPPPPGPGAPDATVTDGQMQELGAVPANRPTIGGANAQASRVSEGAGAGLANASRGGQQPPNQGTPMRGG